MDTGGDAWCALKKDWYNEGDYPLPEPGVEGLGYQRIRREMSLLRFAKDIAIPLPLSKSSRGSLRVHLSMHSADLGSRLHTITIHLLEA